MYKKVFNIVVYMFAVVGFVLVVGFFAVRYGFTNTRGVIDTQRESFLTNNKKNSSATSTAYYWQSLEEWQVIREAVIKDKGTIYRAANSAGVSPRLIVAELITEQLRLFYTEREFYKKFFYPLKILGSQTQFSWGVMGMKETTAIDVENNLKNKSSAFYLGPEYERLLDFKTDNAQNERFARMTDSHNHYYSYLYAGLALHQVITQWQKAGYDISKQPDIISTLYNIGFNSSTPNSNPHSGGAEITIGERTYSFGALAGEFYNSSELLEEFPRE